MSRRTSGFTLVELITVIMLLGILSAVAIGRSTKSSDFEPRLFASTAAEQYRFAHSLATGRYGDPVSFSIKKSAGVWQFVTESDADGEVRREDMANTNVALVVDNGASSVPINVANTLKIEFSSTGDISAAYAGATSLQPDLGIELTSIGDSTHSLCAYPTGYLSTHPCE